MNWLQIFILFCPVQLFVIFAYLCYVMDTISGAN